MAFKISRQKEPWFTHRYAANPMLYLQVPPCALTSYPELYYLP